MNILLIYRAREFSPNMVDKDVAILDSVGEYLRGEGCIVSYIHEEDFKSTECDVDAVMSMCRRYESLELLSIMEQRGTVVINSPSSVENCSRDRMYQLLVNSAIPVANKYNKDYKFPLWLKTCKGWSKTKEDVMFISNASELNYAISVMKDRPYMLVEHLAGDLIKFYGIEGSDFFFWTYASDSHSKYSLEQYNGTPHHYGFSETELRKICSDAARATGLTAYGGDCVIDEDGTIRIIDFNDWPSFSKCRDKASVAIADVALKQIKGR